MVHPILVPVPLLLVAPGPLTLPSPSSISGCDRFPNSEEGPCDYDEKPLHLAEGVCFPSCGTIVGLLRSNRFCRTSLLMSKKEVLPGTCYPSNLHPLPSLLLPPVLKGPSTLYRSTFSLNSFQHHSYPLQWTETTCLTVPFQWNIPNYSSNPQIIGFALTLISTPFVQHYTQWATLCTLELSSSLHLVILHHLGFLPTSLFGFSLSPLKLKTDIGQGFAFALNVFSLNSFIDLSYSAQIIPKFLSSPTFDLSIGLKPPNPFQTMLTAWVVDHSHKWKNQTLHHPCFFFLLLTPSFLVYPNLTFWNVSQFLFVSCTVSLRPLNYKSTIPFVSIFSVPFLLLLLKS